MFMSPKTASFTELQTDHGWQDQVPTNINSDCPSTDISKKILVDNETLFPQFPPPPFLGTSDKFHRGEVSIKNTSIDQLLGFLVGRLVLKVGQALITQTLLAQKKGVMQKDMKCHISCGMLDIACEYLPFKEYRSHLPCFNVLKVF